MSHRGFQIGSGRLEREVAGAWVEVEGVEDLLQRGLVVPEGHGPVLARVVVRSSELDREKTLEYTNSFVNNIYNHILNS